MRNADQALIGTVLKAVFELFLKIMTWNPSQGLQFRLEPCQNEAILASLFIIWTLKKQFSTVMFWGPV